MNRVFKIIWNKTTHRQEVVSELTKGSAKASSASNNAQKATKQFIISILTVFITSTLLASVSNAATINYNDISKQGVAVVSDPNSEILKNVALEGSETLGVLSAIDAVGTLNLMMKRYKGFVHVNAEGYKKGTIKDDGTTSTENTGIWADWLTTSRINAEGRNPGAVFSNNLDRFTEKSGAQGTRSVAVGVYANALATDSIAIGSRANVNNYWGDQYREALNGIAIGQFSSTSTKHAVSDMKIGDTTLSKGVAATDNGTVSFGNNINDKSKTLVQARSLKILVMLLLVHSFIL